MSAAVALPLVGAVVRHMLTTGGGAAIGAATVTPDGSDVQALAGAIATIIGFVLSWLEKRRRDG